MSDAEFGSIFRQPSSPQSDHRPATLIRDARAGMYDRLGQLLDLYRRYLTHLAITRIDPKLRSRICAADLVQETMCSALRDFPQFKGNTEQEFVAWLRQILINNLHDYVQKHILAAKRSVNRELSIDALKAALDRSSVNLRNVSSAKGDPSPSEVAMRKENSLLLAKQLSLMPNRYRDVIMKRSFNGLSFAEVGEQMNCSCGAARMLWLRAIRELRKQLQPYFDDSTVARMLVHED